MIDVLNKEISLISSLQIKLFIKDCISRTPAYFWKVPSSSTGKYHPADENTEGGTVLHTKRAVKIAEDLCRSFNVIGIDRDCVIAATIMHDFCKNGYPNDSGYTVSGHGSLWINVGQTKDNRKAFLTSPELAKIAKLIACHMGRFDIPYVIGPDKLSTIVQLSDYISSREYINIRI